MTSHEIVLQEIYLAITRENELREEPERIPLAPDACLFGDGGMLTSLGLVSLLLDVEDALSERLGASVSLSDERAMASRDNPFRDPETLANHILGRMEVAAV